MEEINIFEKTVLIVDDTPENIDILNDLLRKFKRKVALNGERALKIALTDNPPDIILLDVMMPGMSGYEVCEELRKDERTKEVPIIFLTAKAEKEDVIKGFELGAQDYVTKPFDARELMERVKTHLELKTQREMLESMNDILEEKVRQRTMQLQESNDKLEHANQKLIVLDEAKSTFLRMISHEVRTPLNGIVGASYFLKDSFGDDEEMKDFVDMLAISSERLEKVSYLALIITELQANLIKLSIKEENIFEMLSSAISNIEDDAKKRNIIFNTDNVVRNLEINSERGLIIKAFEILLDNAIRYSPENDIVLIKAWKENGKIQIEITDKGPGFPKEKLEDVLQPFELGEEHEDNHLGISLIAVKLIMENHNAEINIKNNQVGATVSLVF